MSRVVLDSSALIAVVLAESGSERLTPQLLGAATISTVNLAEVQSKLVRGGLDPDRTWKSTLSLIAEPTVFTAEHARIAGDLISATRPLGLSLGDRACLALGLAIGADIYTADNLWSRLKLGVKIHVIR